MITDGQYLNWQAKIKQSPAFHKLWAFFGIYLILFYFIVGGYYALVYCNWKICVATGIAVIFTRYVVCEIIHALYKKQHPYQRLNFSPPKSVLFSFLDKKPDAMPSEHASCAAVVAWVFYAFYPALGIAGFVVAGIIGIARIILGYHEVADVFWGWIVGLFAGLGVIYFLPVIFRY